MLKELDAALSLVGEMPEDRQREILKSVMGVIDDYEDWKANGSPDPDRWYLIKFARDPAMSHLKFQATVKRLLQEDK